MSQKELQRVSVISACIKGDMACARAAGTPMFERRQIKRLKKRMREDGEAALAHANRGRPSHRRLRRRAPTYRASGGRHLRRFQRHHLCEKLVEREGFSLSRETLRRLLRRNGQGSPRKRRAPAHRQRVCVPLALGELVQLDGSPHDWLEGRGPRLTALGMQDEPPEDPGGAVLPSETTFGYLCLLRQVLRRCGVPLAFYGDRSGILSATTTPGRSKNSSRENASPPSSAAPGTTRRHLHAPTVRRPKAASSDSGVCCKIACAVNYAWRVLMTWIPPTRCCANSSPITTPFRRNAPRNGNCLAAGSGKPRTHLLLRARTHRQQRQRRAVGRPPLPDPSTSAPLQFRRCQGAHLPGSRWASRRSTTATRASSTPAIPGG